MKNSCGDLADYLERIPEYLYLLFVEQEADKRGKLYKTVKKLGRIVEFGVQDDRTLTRWILGMLKREGKKITQKDMELLLLHTGNDMSNIEREVDKLLCYTMGREIITEEDIRSNKRDSTTSKARQAAMYIVREVTGLPMKAIGDEFGGRDHSTVLYTLTKIEKEMEKNPSLKATISDTIKNIQDQ